MRINEDMLHDIISLYASLIKNNNNKPLTREIKEKYENTDSWKEYFEELPKPIRSGVTMD